MSVLSALGPQYELGSAQLKYDTKGLFNRKIKRQPGLAGTYE